MALEAPKKPLKLISNPQKRSTSQEKILSHLSFNQNQLEFTPLECYKLVATYGSIIGAIFAMRWLVL